ncbi:MAG: hypothetical protein WC150_14455 [Bacteroidia bacterium]
MKRHVFFIFTIILFFTTTVAKAVDLCELKSRTLKVTVIYSTNILLNKISSFQKVKKLNTLIHSNTIKIKRAFSGFEYTRDIACDDGYYHEDIYSSRIIKRNRKAILSRKIFAPLIPFSVLSFNTFVRKFVLEGTTEYLRQFIFSPFKISVFVLISSLRN